MRSTRFGRPSDFHGSFALFQCGFRTMRSDWFLFHSRIVYGPAVTAGASKPSGTIGVFTGTAEKNGIVIRARKSGATTFSLTVNVWPFALYDATSSRNDDAGDCIFGSRARWNARLKFAAVTADPSLNLKPFLTVKMYVFPSRDT